MALDVRVVYGGDVRYQQNSGTQRARLTAVKDAYDPDYVFDLNHSIAPSRR